MSDDGGPAFPGPDQREMEEDIHEGMSLRDWFAGQVLPGVAKVYCEYDHAHASSVAKIAYIFADAMLRERET